MQEPKFDPMPILTFLGTIGIVCLTVGLGKIVVEIYKFISQLI